MPVPPERVYLEGNIDKNNISDICTLTEGWLEQLGYLWVQWEDETKDKCAHPSWPVKLPSLLVELSIPFLTSGI